MKEKRTVKYYIGDPCYCMKDEFYDDVWCKMECPDSPTWDIYEGNVSIPECFINKFVVTSTQTGDGCYKGRILNYPAITFGSVFVDEFPVDGGCIGIVEESLWKDNFLEEFNEYPCGIIIELSGSLKDYTLDYRGYRVPKNDDGYREYIIRNSKNRRIVFRVAIDTDGYLFVDDDEDEEEEEE